MAKVKDQSIPTDQFEETLDPPIDFRDQYRRALSEGIDHPKLPAGWEMVTFSKKESRPAQRSDNPYYDKPDQQAWRDEFSECEACWKTQYRTEGDLDNCHSAGSKHYVEPWTYIPGAKNTYFNQFMKECLEWAVAHPDRKFPKCEDLTVLADPSNYCPGEEAEINVYKGIPPLTITPSAGEIDEALIWHAPTDPEECPNIVTITASDSEGRKGCAEIWKRDDCPECECEGAELKIIYTTLVMAFREEQTLSIDPAKQGCPPYVWSLEGPGTLVPSEDNLTALFTAPEGNPGCQDSVIQLTDACDLVDEIAIRTSCTGEKYVYNWVYAYRWSCGSYTVNHYYVYTKLYDCFTGDLIDEWFETEFSVIGTIPTTTTQVFCAEEGEGDECYGGCGLTMTTPYCHECEETYCWEDEGCCPPQE